MDIRFEIICIECGNSLTTGSVMRTDRNDRSPYIIRTHKCYCKPQSSEIEKIAISVSNSVIFRKYFPSTANRIDELTKGES